MEDYGIWVDAAADLDRERMFGETVDILPMEYVQGAARRKSVGGESAAELHAFYDRLRGGAVMRTSQIAPEQYRVHLGPVMDREGVLYLALSGGLTKTAESAQFAKTGLMRDHDHAIEVVDTLCASGGIGLLAEKALENRRRGMSLKENAASVREWAGRICQCFMVGDLMYLKRGGRVSAASAVMGTVMGIRPILVVDPEGRLTTVGRIRGQKAALRELLRFYDTAHDMPDEKRVFIVHGDVPDIAEDLKRRLLENDPSLQISISPLCPVIGAHTGPGLIGFGFFGDRGSLTRGD